MLFHHSKLHPKRLLTRIVLWILLGLFIAQGLSLFLLSQAQKEIILRKGERYKLNQFAALVQLLEEIPEPLHDNALTAWSRKGHKFIFKETKPIIHSDDENTTLIKNALLKELGETYQNRILVNAFTSAKNNKDLPFYSLSKTGELKSFNEFHIAIFLTNNKWFYTNLRIPIKRFNSFYESVIFTLISSLLVALMLFWQLRNITLPLRNLSRAAIAIGKGKNIEPLKEIGPDDIKKTLRAFNQMNERIKRFTSERARIFASISHDLRTPITGMRLRLEMMEDSKNKTKLIQSLDEMHLMSKATLSFIKQSEDVELTSLVDIEALVESLCQDLVELSSPVHLQENSSDNAMIIEARPLALKRAINNLIENAIKYGNQAKVYLEKGEKFIIIRIEDTGPGIPEDELDSVFKPFYRLGHNELTHKTYGYGLGMSIAQQIINSHGGKLQLINYEEGLRVLVKLPKH